MSCSVGNIPLGAQVDPRKVLIMKVYFLLLVKSLRDFMDIMQDLLENCYPSHNINTQEHNCVVEAIYFKQAMSLIPVLDTPDLSNLFVLEYKDHGQGEIIAVKDFIEFT